jgi:hypothetical protein
MNKLLVSYCGVGVGILFLMFLPYVVEASEVIFKVVSNGDNESHSTLVEVRLDPQAKRVNVVEGVVEFSGSAAEDLSVQVENGQSILSMWPVPPRYDVNKKNISFTGGVPNGFDTEGLLFKMRLPSKLRGELQISYTGGSVYLNDGKGTQESVTSKPVTLTFDINGSVENTNQSFQGSWYVYGIIFLLGGAVLFAVFKYGVKKIHTQ